MAYSFGAKDVNIPDTASTTAQQLIATNSAQATQLVASAQAALSALGSFTAPTLAAAPVIPAFTRPTSSSGGGAGVTNGGSAATDISIVLPAMPSKPTVNTSDINVSVPTFAGSVSINPPAAPAALDSSGSPTRPNIDTNIAIPDAPQINMPPSPNIEDVLVPAFNFPTLPLFTDTAPTFTEATPNVALEWNEPVYYSPLLDDLRIKVRDVLAGGSGLPAAVEQALFDRARSREESQTTKAVQEAFDTFATRGFNMPPGMLVAQVNAAREEGQMRVSGINRDTMIEAAKWQLENLRMAVEQGIAAENMMIQLHNNGLNRGFEAAKAVIDGHIALFNATVNLYNARQQGFQVASQVYKTKIDAELSRIEVYKAEIEGVKVKGERNEQRVREYTARLQAVTQTVEIYKAQMQGAQTEADVAKAVIESYKTDVDAYSAKLQAEKTRFEAYESAVRGELAKAQILDIDARVFATRMQGAGIQADIQTKMVDAEIATINADTQRFVAELDRSKVELQAASERVQAKLGYMSADTQRFAAENEKARAEREADIRIGEQQLQANIEAAKLGVQQYQTNTQVAIENARLHVTAMQGAAQAASTMAAGAMAAVHVGAQISTGLSYGRTYDVKESGSEQTNNNPVKS